MTSCKGKTKSEIMRTVVYYFFTLSLLFGVFLPWLSFKSPKRAQNNPLREINGNGGCFKGTTELTKCPKYVMTVEERGNTGNLMTQFATLAAISREFGYFPIAPNVYFESAF